MEQQSGGEIAAKSRAPSGGGAAGEDRLSALHDDILVLILLRLRTAEAARTSALSRRWRRVWALLPELRFTFFPESHRFRDALAASAVVPLRYLLIVGLGDVSAESLSTWLPAAARRLSGELVLVDMDPRRDAVGDGGGEEITERGALELPCFEKATSISLGLGFLGLAVPLVGVFARLTELSMSRVRFHGSCDLGEAVSSPRFPCLQKLIVQGARGLENLAIHSKSLKMVVLKKLCGLRQLTIKAALLEKLSMYILFCDRTEQPVVVDISVPQLRFLKWWDAFDPRSVHLGKMECLQSLIIFFFAYGCGPESLAQNRISLMLMSHLKVVESLTLALGYALDFHNDPQYLMEDMTILPDITSLHLILNAKQHSFGAATFHILRTRPGIKRLTIYLSDRFFLEAQDECAQGCICRQPSNWKTDELMLNCLHEVEIEKFRGSEHDLVFVKQLFTWATTLKRMAVTFHHSVSESLAKELCQMLRNFSRPEIHLKFLCAP